MDDVTVYVATAGEYDDYTVVGIFAREDDAKDCALADNYFAETLRAGPMDVRPLYCAVIRSTGKLDVWSDNEEYNGDDRVWTNSRGVASGWDRGEVIARAEKGRNPFESKR